MRWLSSGWKPPVAGEPVMCLRNVHEFGGYNGAVYTLARNFLPTHTTTSLDIDGKRVDILETAFEGLSGELKKSRTTFSWAYVATSHKC